DSNGYVYNQKYDVILKAVMSMESNDDSTIFLNKNGNIFGIGDNTHGVLGLGHLQKVNIPTKINLENVKNIFISSYLTYALTNDDKLYVFGYGVRPSKTGYIFMLPTLINYAPNNIKKIIFSGTTYTKLIILTFDDDVYET